MKASFVSLLAAVGLVAAQSSGNAPSIPQCALSCFVKIIPQTGCGLLDFHCQCTSPMIGAIQQPILSCVTQACPMAEQLQTQEAVNAICNSNGGPMNVAGTPGQTPSFSGGSSAAATPMGSTPSTPGASPMPTSGGSSSSAGSGGFGFGGGAGSSTAASSQAFPTGPRAMSFTSGVEPTGLPVAGSAQYVFAAAAAAGAWAF